MNDELEDESSEVMNKRLRDTMEHGRPVDFVWLITKDQALFLCSIWFN